MIIKMMGGFKFFGIFQKKGEVKALFFFPKNSAFFRKLYIPLLRIFFLVMHNAEKIRKNPKNRVIPN